jgi:N-acetyl-ornithine/N-acetyl-lysine deacetylase
MDDAAALALIERMVGIPSVSGSERGVAEAMVAAGERAGLSCAIDDAGNFVASTRGSPLASEEGEVDIVLLGHMDTVPGDIAVRVEDGVLHGRGAVDAKGPLAAFVAAASRVSARLPAGVRVVVIGAVEEETPTSRGARAVAGRYAPAACVIGEPSGTTGVTVGYKGRLVVRARTVRGMTHTAGRESSAADRVLVWWERVRAEVESINAGREGVFRVVQSSVREVRTASDGLHESALMVAGFRLPQDRSPSEIEAICRREAEADGIELEFSGAEACVVADARSVVARALLDGVRREAGERPRILYKSGTSDMNVVAPAWGCPIAAYGAGDSALDHTPEERIVLAEYLTSIRVLEHAIGEMATELVAGVVTVA